LVKKDGKEAFLARIASAQTLSDYFFEQLSETIDLKGIEGRAQLMKASQPYLSKLADGFYKQMLLEKLKAMAGLSGGSLPGGVSPNIAKNLARQVRAPEKLRITPSRMAIALLLQNPRLIKFIETRDVHWEEMEFPGVELFKKVHTAIERQFPANSAVLLEMFRDSSDYKLIEALIYLELLVLEEDMEAVFCGTLDRLLEQSNEQKKATLLLRFEEVGAAGLTERELKALKELKQKK
jgi:DNA primase